GMAQGVEDGLPGGAPAVGDQRWLGGVDRVAVGGGGAAGAAQGGGSAPTAARGDRADSGPLRGGGVSGAGREGPRAMDGARLLPGRGRAGWVPGPEAGRGAGLDHDLAGVASLALDAPGGSARGTTGWLVNKRCG